MPKPKPADPVLEQDAPASADGDAPSVVPGATDSVVDPIIRVVSRRAGFRRAGRAWSVEPTVVPVSEFTTAQIQSLRAEPMLIVEDV